MEIESAHAGQSAGCRTERRPIPVDSGSDTNQVTVAVNRSGFTSPVPIEFAGLPAGVRVVEADKKIQNGESSATFTLQADQNAALVDKQRVVVTAFTPGGAETREEFRVTVKEAR